jgi:hypothetical protein
LGAAAGSSGRALSHAQACGLPFRRGQLGVAHRLGEAADAVGLLLAEMLGGLRRGELAQADAGPARITRALQHGDEALRPGFQGRRAPRLEQRLAVELVEVLHTMLRTMRSAGCRLRLGAMLVPTSTNIAA